MRPGILAHPRQRELTLRLSDGQTQQQQTRVDRHRQKQDVREAEREGQFKEMDDVSRSLSADRRTRAKRSVKAGHGDQGDRASARKGAKKK